MVGLGFVVFTLIFARQNEAADASVYPSGPMKGKPVSIAWGAKSLKNYTGYSPAQFTSLATFSSQPELLVPEEHTTIWDYFPLANASQYPLTNGPFMQSPQTQDPTEMVATACDSCYGVLSQNLVYMPPDSSDWEFVWNQASTVLQKVLVDSDGPQNDNTSNFKVAINWFTYPSNSTVSSHSASQDVNAVCSTLYLEGLTGMNKEELEDLKSVIPEHFQDFAVQCGCDWDNTGFGSAGSPFRGGWKVMMRGLTEAWRFRVELFGAGCQTQSEKTS